MKNADELRVQLAQVFEELRGAFTARLPPARDSRGVGLGSCQATGKAPETGKESVRCRIDSHFRVMRPLFKISSWFVPLARRVLYSWVRTTVFAEGAAGIDPGGTWLAISLAARYGWMPSSSMPAPSNSMSPRCYIPTA